MLQRVLKRRDGIQRKEGRIMFGLIPRRAERKLAREIEKPFGLMRAELAELFDHFFPAWPWEEVGTGLEVVEKEKEILVRVAVPGLEPAELAVEVVGNVLTIRGEHKKEEKEAPKRPYEMMVRSFILPVGIEVEKVEARCKNGVLEIYLPRKPEAMTRHIEVKT
jgi:HSP20 family protein